MSNRCTGGRDSLRTHRENWACPVEPQLVDEKVSRESNKYLDTRMVAEAAL
jgi:hypothetical protein